MNFKHYLNNHFDSCLRVAETFDVHRSRPVRVFALPGHFDHVGVSDGTDSWIAPINAINPFWIDVRKIMEQLRSGTPLHEITKVRARLRLERPPPVDPPPKRVRVTLAEAPPAKKRVRVALGT